VTLDFVCFGRCCRCYCHLQTHQACVPPYILENVPLLGDTRFHVMASVHEIRSWIGPMILLDVARGWFVCSLSTIMVDELSAKGGVETGI
jgi:hypothetical protein